MNGKNKKMENIVIIPENKKQFSAIKTFLEEMKIRFKIEEQEDALMTEEVFYAKIDQAIEEVKNGGFVEYTPEVKQELFGSIL